MGSGDARVVAGDARTTSERMDRNLEAAVKRALDDLEAQEQGPTAPLVRVAFTEERHTVASAHGRVVPADGSCLTGAETPAVIAPAPPERPGP